MAAFIRVASASSSASTVSASFPGTDWNFGSLAVIGVSSREPITSVDETTSTISSTRIAFTQDTFGPTVWGEMYALLKTIILGSDAGATAVGSTTATKSIMICEYANSAAGSDTDTSIIDGTHTGTNFGTAMDTGATAANTNTPDISVVVVGQEPAGQTTSFNAPYTSRGDKGTLATTVSMADQDLSTLATRQSTGTVGGGSSVVWVAMIANFKLAGATAAEPIFPRTPPGQFARLRR